MTSFKPIVDWLSYRSYESQRLRRPDIPYFKWRKLYKDAAVFEEIFDNFLRQETKESPIDKKLSNLDINNLIY